MNILIIRFRQMGDAILSTVVMNSLRKTFPDARIDFVLNDYLAPLFQNHPAIDNIITFTNEERHSLPVYLRKVWKTVHQTNYDVIIDMRSTINTMVFSLFSMHTRFRIGLRKPYTHMTFNHRFDQCRIGENMIDHNLAMIEPLSVLSPIKATREFTINITEDEIKEFATYMRENGIDFEKPIMLVGTSTKLEYKTWPIDRMANVLKKLMRQYPDLQLIFNYVPGHEEEDAWKIYHILGKPDKVFIKIQAHTMRELASMTHLVTCYFGSEGGVRHIAHAMGCPSLVIMAPGNSASIWIPKNEIKAESISVEDITNEDTSKATSKELFRLISEDHVWARLKEFMIIIG